MAIALAQRATTRRTRRDISGAGGEAPSLSFYVFLIFFLMFSHKEKE